MPAHLAKLETAPDLVEQVYSSLLDAISEGSLAPGERLTQEDIAERLAGSRQPVLQALRLLKKDGFVLDAPGRGVLVAPLDPGWTLKVYQVRGALDALAVRLAAGHRFHMDPKIVELGRKTARRAEKLIDHHSRQASEDLAGRLSFVLTTREQRAHRNNVS